jgi:hypothetical protein
LSVSLLGNQPGISILAMFNQGSQTMAGLKFEIAHAHYFKLVILGSH